MKKHLLYGTAALLAAGLAACSDEPAAEISKEKLTYGTAYGTMAQKGMDSRSVRPEDENFNLGFGWADNVTEKVLVIDTDPAYDDNPSSIGILSRSEGNGFAGGLSLSGRQTVPVTVAYLGHGVDPSANTPILNYPVDLASQSGRFEDLPAKDIMLATGNNVNVNADGNWGLNFQLTSVLAFAHFTIALPRDVEFTEGNTVSVSGVYTKSSVNLATGEFGGKEEGTITITNATKKADGRVDFFFAMIPGAQTVKINIQAGDRSYEWTAPIEVDFKGNNYYRKDNGDGLGSTATPDGKQGLRVDYWYWDLQNKTKALAQSTFTWLEKGAEASVTADPTHYFYDQNHTFGPYTADKIYVLNGTDNEHFLNAINGSSNNEAGNTVHANVTEADGTKVINLLCVFMPSLTYDANGGTIDDEGQYVMVNGMVYHSSHSSSFSLGDFYAVEREGYECIGWADTPDAVAPKYGLHESITVLNPTTVYAVWKELPKNSQVGVDAGNLPAHNPWK